MEELQANMAPYLLQIIETAVVIILFFLIKWLVRRVIRKRIILNEFSDLRRKIALKSTNTILNILAVCSIVIVWSIEQSQIYLFLSSTLTILGVAFFAQWSHLSNITSGMIIFFNSATKVGDQISILDKDFPIVGQIVDIGLIFIKIKTEEGAIVSLPNNILLQKAIRVH